MTRRKRIKEPRIRVKKPPKHTARALRILDAQNNWEALSVGLSPQEKRALAGSIRGTGCLPISIQYMMIKPDEEMWRSMALFCCRKIAARELGAKRNDRVFAYFVLPYNYRNVLKSFPIGELVDADMFTVTMRVNCILVLDWLWKRGYSDFNARALTQRVKVVRKELTDMTKDLYLVNKWGYDTDILNAWADIINNEEGETNDN